MPLTIEDFENMPAETKAKLDVLYESAKARVVSDRNREALDRLEPLLEYAVEQAARHLLVDALTWKELQPDEPHLWAFNEELARRIIDNRANAWTLVHDAEAAARSRASHLRLRVQLGASKDVLRPLP